jgi:phosphoglycerate-specific signal transduction histidine kinase
VSRIVQSLMSFAHAGSHQHSDEPVCLAEVAQDAIGLLALNRRNFEVQFFNLCDPDHWVEGDPAPGPSADQSALQRPRCLACGQRRAGQE